MTRSRFPWAGVLLASLAAGPLFITLVVLATLYQQLPAAIGISASAVAAIGLLLLPSTFFGAILSFVPNMLGAGLMFWLSEQTDLARAASAWVAAGAIMGGIIAIGIDLSAFAFGIILTSAICAYICHFFSHWSVPARD